ncbi:MAG TPA: PAS domain-containing protein [Polyangia bacterium]|nr:PAS domain-containing protein [Polyangia bacterium]
MARVDGQEQGAKDRERLRKSEQRLRLLLDHHGDAVFMLDTEGRVVTWTPAATRIVGIGVEEGSRDEPGRPTIEGSVGHRKPTMGVSLADDLLRAWHWRPR